MASLIEKITEIVNALPEQKAEELLDFAEFLRAKQSIVSPEFFDLAGIWEGREIDQAELREKAWPVNPE